MSVCGLMWWKVRLLTLLAAFPPRNKNILDKTDSLALNLLCKPQPDCLGSSISYRYATWVEAIPQSLCSQRNECIAADMHSPIPSGSSLWAIRIGACRGPNCRLKERERASRWQGKYWEPDICTPLLGPVISKLESSFAGCCKDRIINTEWYGIFISQSVTLFYSISIFKWV